MIVIILRCSKPYVKHTTTVETIKDGRFIAYDNGTVLDTKTKLMWAIKDNGSDIGWQDAKFYCENYNGGGYNDWRMPALDELEGLYDEAKPVQQLALIAIAFISQRSCLMLPVFIYGHQKQAKLQMKRPSSISVLVYGLHSPVR